MGMCRLTVRARDGVWDDEVDCWTSLVVLAALSAEPETFTELAEAVRRYQPDHGLFDQPRPTADSCEAEADEPWCLIDLLGRTVVAGAGFDLPEPHSAFEADVRSGRRRRGDGVPHRLARHTGGLVISPRGR